VTVRAGVLLNPIAGYGGALALHGTDELPDELFADAVASCRAARRLVRALDQLGTSGGRPELIAPPGLLGSDALVDAGIAHDVLHIGVTPARTTSADTVRAARALVAAEADVIVFVGGDGTATDIARAIGDGVPVIGVPAGVKMHSEVFARSPEAAGRMLGAFAAGRSRLEPAEILDVGPDDTTGVVGVLQVPRTREPLQGAKSVSPAPSAAQAATSIAETVVGEAHADTTWVIGPGTTTAAVAAALGIPATLRGVDVRHPDGAVEADVTEERLFAVVTAAAAPRLVLGVVGGQGFLLGRGNQQISPRVVRALGPERVQILAGEEKVAALFPPVLLIDADPDGAGPHPLLGYRAVRVGARQSTVLKVVDAAAAA